MFENLMRRLGRANPRAARRQKTTSRAGITPFARARPGVEALEARELPSAPPGTLLLSNHDLDGDGKADLVYQQGNQILIQTAKGLSRYNVGPWQTMRAAELDGRPGEELLFTSVTVDPYTGRADGSATVLTARTGSVQQYHTGPWQTMQVVDLDGQPGAEVLFTEQTTNYATLQSDGWATVLTARTGGVRQYHTGPWQTMQVKDVDGIPGNEVVFTLRETDWRTGRSSTVTTVLTHRTGTVQVSRS